MWMLLLWLYVSVYVCSSPVSQKPPQAERPIHLSTTLTPVKSLQLSAAASGPKPSSVGPCSIPSPLSSTSPVQQPLPQPSYQSSVDNGRRTIPKVPSPDSDDDEVEVIQAFCARPTRSGRIPRPAVRPSDEDHTDHVAADSADRLKTGVGSQSDAPTNILSTKPAVTSPQPTQSQDDQLTTGLVQSSAVSIPAPPASTLPVTSSSGPQIDLSNLPPGYFVIVEAPQSSSDQTASQQQALYHIFAVDHQGTSQPPAVSTQRSTSAAAWQPSASPSTVAGYSQPERFANSSTVQRNQRHTEQKVLSQRLSSSSTQDVTEICDDLSGLANCELTAVRQEDGTVIIQTVPAMSNRSPLSHPPPTQVLQWPTPTHETSLKLVPRFPSAQRQTALHRETEIVDRNRVEDAQYVDIIVEDCDNLEL